MYLGKKRFFPASLSVFILSDVLNTNGRGQQYILEGKIQLIFVFLVHYERYMSAIL